MKSQTVVLHLVLALLFASVWGNSQTTDSAKSGSAADIELCSRAVSGALGSDAEVPKP